jgi:peptide/nickel transport system permease protein
VSAARRLGAAGLGLAALAALLAPVLAPNRPGDQFADRAYAPAMRVHLHDGRGWHAPFVYRQRLDDRLMRRYATDTAVPLRLRWFTSGRIVSVPGGDPLLLFGADALGRDVFSRLLFGAQLSLGVTLLGALGALAVGVLVGGLAGSAGGRVDAALTFAADFVLVLPAVYLVLVLRAMLPLVLTTPEVFALMASLFTFAAWPHVARGVRAVVATERTRDYAEAARAAGAGPLRVMAHLLPAARGFLAAECVLLVPALLTAETTISYLGLGFPEPTPSWGTMLQDAANVRVMMEAPWMLAPAVALFIVVLSVQLVGGSRAPAQALLTAGAPRPRTGSTAVSSCRATDRASSRTPGASSGNHRR